ncbi:hypothetical protein [uncultured Faecalibaculum sp.]|uniref:hypothetical protein n=2 Tax=uncultured Faecalibaculum sp. TaxID=1729681 RepID=UPI0025CF0824|nr:hypothetical protein [uncultured Faecalibaculum sp.]
MKSMVSVVCVVCLSSLYTGFFEQTAILRRVKQLHIPPILYALLTCSLACSQTLALVLSAQLLSGQYRNREELAITLEDTVVPVAALVPWSIASLAPLSFLGITPTWQIMLWSFYLYVQPIWWWAASHGLPLLHNLHGFRSGTWHIATVHSASTDRKS